MYLLQYILLTREFGHTRNRQEQRCEWGGIMVAWTETPEKKKPKPWCSCDATPKRPVMRGVSYFENAEKMTQKKAKESLRNAGNAPQRKTNASLIATACSRVCDAGHNSPLSGLSSITDASAFDDRSTHCSFDYAQPMSGNCLRNPS